MKILAIETSSLAGGVALMDESRLIAEYRLNVEVRHAERVMVSIDHLLQQSQTQVKDLDAIAVSIGPGSFTGLRVGLATAKGLAVGAGLPLVLVPTLEAMAAAFPFSNPLITPFVDARREEVYWALFDSENGKLKRLLEDAAVSPEAAIEQICTFDAWQHRGILFIGDGAAKYQDVIVEKMGDKAYFSTRALQFPLAASVAELGLARFQNGELTPPALANPLYLRASTAELKKAEAAKK